ncbi:acyltransferase [Citrobacter sedlakii]|uniref:acyltransferase n=1 Tax=Citrobacter sedlakii TaxID=67826 RepID=UPI0022B36378|nr:acyltransferase [Citrobacter sedlakii]MCZ4673403.1 acyltransferase [Citrobacter sedlakii]MDR5003459.1 acyltransferase [Citrobacter sedlakii]
MAFLTQSELKQLGFKKLGKNVKISNKASIYNHDQIEIGDDSRIDDFCILSGKISIGNNVHIAAYCNVAGGEKGIVLDDFSGLAYGCQILAQSDDYTGMSMTNPTVPKKYKNETIKTVTIGRHVIVGTNSVILPGVHVADGCSVGAMTMVTKSTQPWGVYFGVPAKRIKERKKNILELEVQYKIDKQENL